MPMVQCIWGASPKEAVKAACELCAMVAEPIIQEWIPR